ncbi:MAG: cytochrome P460 family protein [Paludibaculum sp.]
MAGWRFARRRSAELAALAASCWYLWASPPTVISYPSQFRNWAHVKTQLIGEKSPFFAGSGGIHHVYANDKALEGLKTGRYADGSVLVFDLVEAHEKAGVTVEGERVRVDVMIKSATQFPASGGWGFERFLGADLTKGTLDENGRQGCAGCHKNRRDRDFVFSELRP